jgi:hypothetical protein
MQGEDLVRAQLGSELGCQSGREQKRRTEACTGLPLAACVENGIAGQMPHAVAPNPHPYPPHTCERELATMSSAMTTSVGVMYEPFTTYLC